MTDTLPTMINEPTQSLTEEARQCRLLLHVLRQIVPALNEVDRCTVDELMAEVEAVVNGSAAA